MSPPTNSDSPRFLHPDHIVPNRPAPAFANHLPRRCKTSLVFCLFLPSMIQKAGSRPPKGHEVVIITLTLEGNFQAASCSNPSLLFSFSFDRARTLLPPIWPVRPIRSVALRVAETATVSRLNYFRMQEASKKRVSHLHDGHSPQAPGWEELGRGRACCISSWASS
jgi:hypothetical protein